MKVKRNTLLLLACLVMSAAGFNILRIGLNAYPAYLTMSELPSVYTGLRRVSKVYIWKIGKKAYRKNYLLSGGTALFSEIF